MNQKTIIIILAVLLLASLCYIAYNFTTNKAYNQGLIDGQSLIINNIQQTGNIPIITTENNQTKINWIPITQICSGG